MALLKFVKYINLEDWNDSTIQLYSFVLLYSEHNILNPSIQLFKSGDSILEEKIEPDYFKVDTITNDIHIGTLSPFNGKFVVI